MVRHKPWGFTLNNALIPEQSVTNKGIATDSKGNVIIVGSFFGTVDLDPSGATYELTPDNYPFLIAKYDASGRFLWGFKIDSSTMSYFTITSIQVDSNDNIIIGGTSDGYPMDFDPGAGTGEVNHWRYTPFIAKYNSSGEFVWVKTIIGNSANYLHGMAIDANNNILVTGQFARTADFDPSGSTSNLVATGNTLDYHDIYIAKYDTDGALVWAKGIGGTFTEDRGRAIATDATGAVFVSGIFDETVDFDPGAGTENLTADQDQDMFLAKYNSSGEYQWAIRIGATTSWSHNEIFGLAVDSNDDVYAVGEISTTMNFNPNGTTYNIGTTGGIDILLAKYEGDTGVLAWGFNIGRGDVHDIGAGITIDASDHIIITGNTSTGANFNPLGTSYVPSGSVNQPFLAKFDVNGANLWAKIVSTGNGTSNAQSVASDDNGNIFLAGTYASGNDFDFGAGTLTLSGDGFLVKYSPNGNLTPSITLQGTAGWRLMSSSLSSKTYNDILSSVWTQGFTGADQAGTSNVYTWSTSNGTDAVSNWTSITNQSSSIPAGRGFLAYIFSDDNGPAVEGDSGFPKVLEISGSEPGSDVEVTVNTNANGYTLAGNPFLSTVDWDAFTKSNLTGSVYVWNAKTSSWISWNGTTGSLTGGTIPPFTGFFVQNAASGTPALTIPTSAKTGSSPFYSKSKSESYTGFSINISGSSLSDKAWFSFSQNGLEGLDNLDAKKLSPLSPEFLQLGSVIGSGKTLDINHLPLEMGQISVPLMLSSSTGGTFTLSFENLQIPDNWIVSLIDNETGKAIGRGEKLVIEATASAKKGKGFELANPVEQIASLSDARFMVTIDRQLTTSNELPANEARMFRLNPAFPNPFNPTTTISYSLGETGSVKVQVVDLSGRVVSTLIDGIQQKGDQRISWDASRHSSGLYIVRMTAGNRQFTQKITLLK